MAVSFVVTFAATACASTDAPERDGDETTEETTEETERPRRVRDGKADCNPLVESCPTVNPPPPQSGSCVGSCGGQSDGGCYCDTECAQFGDCCDDFKLECGPTVNPPPPGSGTCENNCGEASPDKSCYCDAACAQYGDCCDDFKDFCEAPVEEPCCHMADQLPPFEPQMCCLGPDGAQWQMTGSANPCGDLGQPEAPTCPTVNPPPPQP